MTPPTGWQVTTLGCIAELMGGGTPSRKISSLFGHDIEWVTPSDLPRIGDVRPLGTVAEGLSTKGLSLSSAKRLPPGTVLFSSRASIGKIAVADRACCTNQGFVNLIPNIKCVDPWFLAYYLSLKTPDIAALAGETTFKEVSRSKLREFPFCYPAINEQCRIVARIKECMERAEEIERLRDESLKERGFLIESLIEAELRSAAGIQVRLADVCSITSRLVDPREPQFQPLLHVGGANIEPKSGRLIDLRTVAEENLKSGKFTFDQSMVLYNKIRPYLMKVARPAFSGLCSADMYPLAPVSDRLTRDYLFYVLMSRHFTDYAIDGSNRAGMPKVNREYLFAYEFTLPSVDIQKNITEQLDSGVEAILNLETEMVKTKAEVGALRESILRKAFAGEL